MADEYGEYLEDERAMLVSLFRYSVIGPLVERDSYAPGEVTQLVSEIAEQTHYLASTGPITVTERTVYAWLRRYRQGGIKALGPKVRKDRGVQASVERTGIAKGDTASQRAA